MTFSNLAKKNVPVYSIKLEDFCRKLSIVSLFMLPLRKRFCLLYLMFKQTDFQCLLCSISQSCWWTWIIMEWFNLFLQHSSSKILVLSLLRAEAKHSLTAFVAGTTKSIKLHKFKNFWEIINSCTGEVSQICHHLVQSKVSLSTKLCSESLLLLHGSGELHSKLSP